MENLEYLFAAYSVVWLVLAAYIYLLYARQRKMRQELEVITSKLEGRSEHPIRSRGQL